MDWKKFAQKLLFPPLWVVLPLTVLCTAALTAVFVQDWEASPLAYGVYVLSFYTLCTAAAYCALVLPKQYRRIKQKFLDHPLGGRYMTDAAFRTKVSLHVSLGINLLYVGLNVLSWYLYRSWWFVCLAVYYGILSGMRFLLVRCTVGQNRRRELRRALACAWIMLLLNLFLSGAVLMVVYQDRGYEYHGVMIYIMAMYTFYTAAHAVTGLIRYRRMQSPVLSAAKRISVAAALVSVLNLETAMFAEFGGEMAKGDQRLMIILTGAGISLAVIAMAVHGIVSCTKEIKELRKTSHGA